MYIHRAFFAQALIDHPTNPLKSHYAPSFLAAYRASATILKSIREQFAIWPITCGRFWTMWTFAFTAAVSLFLHLTTWTHHIFTEGRFWNRCHSWPTVAISTIGDDGIGTGVCFVLESGSLQ